MAPEDLAPLDRPGALPATSWEAAWQEHGWVHLPGFMPDALLDAYEAAWLADNDAATGLSTWGPTAYRHVDAVRELCLYEPLVRALEPLVGGTVGLHLNLTNWRSTTRDWHQDDYLNPEHVNSWYAATWVALRDVDPDAGPFQYVDGSHRWPRLRHAKVLEGLDLDATDPDWPTKSEQRLTPLVEEEISRRGAHAQVATYVPKRGDVLIWHGCLYHRGTVPRHPWLERRVCISHYSAVHRRPDMATWHAHPSGGRCYG